LGLVGYFASSSSRVIVPSVLGQSASSASSILTAAGLTPLSGGSTSTNATSGNDGTVASQSISSGSDAERGTNVSYVLYSYTAPCVPNWQVTNTTSSCSNCQTTYYDTYTDVNGCGQQPYTSPRSGGSCDSGTTSTQIQDYVELVGQSMNSCTYWGYRRTIVTNICTNTVVSDTTVRRPEGDYTQTGTGGTCAN
jgi:beta-lactam-binding protein with PASTA domain